MQKASSLLQSAPQKAFWTNLFIFAIVSISFLGSELIAGTPEYMQLTYKVGQAYEIELVTDKNGALTANDIEELPKPREPKLRGEIKSIVADSAIVRMFGISVKFTTETEFVMDGTEKYSFASLKQGQRVEISCKISDANEWIARKVSVTNIKKSDKVKGTVTRVAVDGRIPDTLEISGINILLVPETDVNKPTSYREVVKEELFGALAPNTPTEEVGRLQVGNSIVVIGDYRQTFRTESELDLSRRFDSNQSEIEPYLRLTAMGYINPELRGLAQARVWKNFVISSQQDEASSSVKLEMTQFYLLAPNIGNTGFAAQIGRQNFESPREWLFDDYLDAARLYFFGVTPLRFEVAAIHSVNPLNSKFRTWTDLYGMVAVRLDKYNSISAYMLSRSDTDIRNREPIWWGATYTGRIRSQFRPWANFALMRGTDKGRPLNAYAFDLGSAYVATGIEWTPSITVGYAFASGDDLGSADTDQEFRQTGYEDNTSRFGGLSKSSIYGLVLNPELSNLAILTVGAGCRPFGQASLELFYRVYRQHHAAPDLQGTGLVDPPARPNGSNDDIGSAIDLIASSPLILQSMRLVWSIGIFNPGDAYEPRQKRASVSRLEMNISF